MILTTAMKDFIDEYVEQNMPKAYDTIHCKELEDAFREELGAITNSFETEVLECVRNFVERHPEFEKTEVELGRSVVCLSVLSTPAYQASTMALRQRNTNKDLIVKRMYASVGMFKTMEELVEAMDTLIAEFKE